MDFLITNISATLFIVFSGFFMYNLLIVTIAVIDAVVNKKNKKFFSKVCYISISFAYMMGFIFARELFGS